MNMLRLAAFVLAALFVVRIGNAEDDLSLPYQRLSAQVRNFEPVRVQRIALQSDEPTVPIVIYQTSDIHGHLDFYKGDPEHHHPASGGAAALSTLFKTERPRDLWLDSGDWFQGTPEGDFSRGDATMDIFNALHLDATVVGNHDYDLGEANVARLVGEANFPVLGSNVSGTPGLVPYIVRNVHGVRIGIMGILTTEMSNGLATPNNISHTNFGDEAIVAQQTVRKLRATAPAGEGCDVVIALTHLGIEQYGHFHASDITQGDIYLAKNVDGIDLILGGHTHVIMDHGPLIEGTDQHKTMIIQPGAYLSGVYQIVLGVGTRTKAIKTADAHFIPLDPQRYPGDPAIQSIVNRYKAMTAQRMDQPLGSSQVEMLQNATGEGVIYNWVSDTFRKVGHSDIGIVNTFGLRGGLPAGPLTYRSIYSVMPFGNQMATLTLSGAELRKAVETSLPDKPGDAIMLRFSGVRIVFDPQQPVGQKTLCSGCSLTVAGAPVNDNSNYSVTTMDYVAMSELAIKRHVQIQNLLVTSTLAREALAQEIRDDSPVTDGLDGRVSTVDTSARLIGP